MTPKTSHEFYMRRALELARLGSGRVSPNPMVGCVIVRDGVVLCEGWHNAYGDVHAEVDALRLLQGNAIGATMYVSLEPCSHHGKQPPCTDAIIASGVTHVVVAMTDPNPLVSGRGIEALRAAGIAVTTNVLRDEAEHLNRAFLHWTTTGLPHVTLKIATSIDGRIRMPEFQPRFITSVESRLRVHRMRASRDGIMIGIGTAIWDNPELTVRLCAGRNPVRIVVDPSCRLPTTTTLVQTARDIRTMVVCRDDADPDAQRSLIDLGVEIHTVSTDDQGVIDSRDILRVLARQNIASILLEGGPYLAGRMLRDDVIDEIEIHTAPLIIGTGPVWFADNELTRWKARHARRVGSDIHAQYVRRR